MSARQNILEQKIAGGGFSSFFLQVRCMRS